MVTLPFSGNVPITGLNNDKKIDGVTYFSFAF